MQIPINNIRWYDNLWASLTIFTRLPLHHIYRPPKESRLAAMEFWPLTGWLTATLTAMVIYFGHIVLPYAVALLLAIGTRSLLTGSMNEKGLCRFIGNLTTATANRRDAAGTRNGRKANAYGITAVAIYEAALFASLLAMPPTMAIITILAAEPFAKMVAGQLIIMMPHAQTDCDTTPEAVFRHPTTRAAIGMAVQGLLPMAAYIYATLGTIDWQYVVFAPCLVMYILYMILWRKLGGYTASGCIAVAILTELAVYAAVAFTSGLRIL